MIKTRQIIKKWGSASPMAKASICFSLAMFLQKGLVSLTTPIFTRIMTTVEYEQYTVYHAWSGILTIVATLNLSSGVLNNLLVRGEYKRDTIVSALQGLSSVWAIGCVLIFLALCFFGVQIPSFSVYLWLIMLLSFVVTQAYDDWMVARRFTYDYKIPCLIMVIIAVMNIVLPLAFVLLARRKGEAYILATILVNAVVGLVFWIYNWRKSHRVIVPAIWKQALLFNLPLLPHFLSLTVLNQSDKIMIESLCEPGQAAIYSVAHTVAAIIQLLMTAVNYSLVPWTYQNLKIRRCREIANRSNAILLAVAVALGVIILFAPEIMLIMAPLEYREAVYIIPAMSVGIYFNYLYQFYGRLEMYHRKNRYMMIGSVGCALANIALNAVFIRKYGYMAAAYTTLFCQMALCVMHGVLAQRIVRKERYEVSPFANKQILAISLSLLAVNFVMPRVYASAPVRWALIIGIMLAVLFNRKHIMRFVNKLVRD